MSAREGEDQTHRCPWCERVYRRAESRDFPFCSSRCRLLDLGGWLDGAYAFSRPISEEEAAFEASRPEAGREESP